MYKNKNEDKNIEHAHTYTHKKHVISEETVKGVFAGNDQKSILHLYHKILYMYLLEHLYTIKETNWFRKWVIP